MIRAWRAVLVIGAVFVMGLVLGWGYARRRSR